MNHDFRLPVPASFDDSDADAQVHPVARLLFSARSAAEVFGEAQQWMNEHEHQLSVVDVSWNYADGEPEPFTLALYFVFDEEPGEG
ncbi:hypothetical protein ACFYY2_19900 [Streptomyces sp. NPDC001822]|uniref:hypothetical protein n=1 Tax=Streptomyces sp. NPDC001822 TaxID=3364614 RepID=UPI00367E9516